MLLDISWIWFCDHNSSSFCIQFQVGWPTKLFLAHGVVCGMEYLHSLRPHPVIHGDLKIQNVLVGDGLVAKVCTVVHIELLQERRLCNSSHLYVCVCDSTDQQVDELTMVL